MDNLFSDFMAAMHLMRRVAGHGGPPHAAHHGQGRLLGIIAESQPANQKDLVEKLDIRPSSLSELLKKLEQKGYVKRAQDENDRRNFIVSLTEEGAKAAEEATSKSKTIEEKMFGALTAEEREQLKYLIGKLNTAWSELPDEPPCHPAPPPPAPGFHGPHFPQSRMRMREFPPADEYRW